MLLACLSFSYLSAHSLRMRIVWVTSEWKAKTACLTPRNYLMNKNTRIALAMRAVRVEFVLLLDQSATSYGTDLNSLSPAPRKRNHAEQHQSRRW